MRTETCAGGAIEQVVVNNSQLAGLLGRAGYWVPSGSAYEWHTARRLAHTSGLHGHRVIRQARKVLGQAKQFSRCPRLKRLERYLLPKAFMGVCAQDMY
jgi:hypothetical protein